MATEAKIGKVKIGLIGTGNISAAYIKWTRSFEILDLAACADIDLDKARKVAADNKIPKLCSVEDLLADPEIQIVVNLTIPAAHAAVSLAVIEAGKHVYSEKPLAVTREDGQKIVSRAREKGVLVGCAPDTFLGGGQQTCRKLIEEGQIGEPVAAVAFMAGHGPESWHPNPDFYYQPGGGPMLDMGPYYLTALINLLGPVRRVMGSTRMSFKERIATSAQHNGRRIPVEVSTHVAGVLDFAAGPVGTIITSFDVWGHSLPRIEVYGSEGSLSVPDPNIFGGPVKLFRGGQKEWAEIPLSHTDETGRGIGVADMAYAIQSGRPHRAHGDMAFHVLDIMHAFEGASATNQQVLLQSTCTRPLALPVNLPQAQLDR